MNKATQTTSPADCAVDTRGPRNWVKYTIWLVLLTLMSWIAIIRWLPVLPTMGILNFGTPFLDSYAILAAVDAVRAGTNPHMANPLDPLMRGHVYSDWWLALKYLGLTRENNGLVATIWISAFAVVGAFSARARNWGEILWLYIIFVSPSVLLAITRANNDLVIFVLLAGCSLPAMSSRWWKNGIAVGCLMFATGLKYFPAAGVLSFLWIRPVRRMPAMFLMALAGVALAMTMVADQIDRGRFFVQSGLHTMGAALFWRDFGWKDVESVLPCLIVIILVAIGLTVCRVTSGLASRGNAGDRMRAATGAVVLLGCFLSGVSYAYRWIFVIWPAVWLWRQIRDMSTPPRDRWATAIACLLIVACIWSDGLLCILANLVFPPMKQQAMQNLLVSWRHWTQPLPWLLMMLLSGWLTEASWATIREWWSLRHDP